MNYLEFDINMLTKSKRKIQVWVAVKLIQLAAIVMGATVEVKFQKTK
jgi:hypothetical protein